MVLLLIEPLTSIEKGIGLVGGKILGWCFFSGVRVVGFGGKVVTLG